MKSFARRVAAAMAGGVLLAGCGGNTGVSTSPDTSPGGGAANSSSPEPTSTAPQTSTGSASSSSGSESETLAPAQVGDRITLKGNADGSQAAVTARKVVDPTRSTDGFSEPSPGMRYVAVQFQIVNTGTSTYDDSPSNGAKVADADGQQFTSTILMSVAAGPLLPASVKLAPGGKALGYIVFEVPKTAKLSAVQFGMDSGFGETGEWLIK